MAKSVTKNALFVFLSRNFRKAIAIFEISIFDFVKNEFLIRIVNFAIGSAFS